MANYNTFVIVGSKSESIIMVTSSARKANELLSEDNRIEVWSNNEKFADITIQTKDRMRAYIRIEKNYIRRKQERATKKNKLKKEKKQCQTS